ncbi:DUF6916 family protein [Nocardioides abyssi]|uniref:DUF6916 domain-containing protein n=1 Tax=Nocardioides abyssi TaxID=3058370 RepID=A0ABT8EZ20_9ACTN|nr:hypothetical protein [Nocardioides abyssi]MDN4163324.1 hypothetical protein [Nocardioides abyssi]
MATPSTLDIHRALNGATLEVLTSDHQVVVGLRVDAVREHAPNGPQRGHTVELSAPAESPLDQDTYTVRWPDGTLGWLFVVPVAEQDGRRTYEAVFTELVTA